MPEQDYFDDVAELKQAQFGALGGEGSAALEQTKTTVTKEGIRTHCACGQCGAPNIVTVEWPEAIIGSMALVPDGWKVDQQNHALSPFNGCACRCGYWVQLLFTPQELDRYVQTAVQQGILNGGQVVQTKQNIAAQSQQRGGGMPQQYRR